MQKLKINKFYLALLALCITFYAQPMDRPEPRDMFVIGWASVVGSILLGASTLRDLLPSTHKQVLTESSNFIQLPKEIRNEIIKLVSLNNTAPSLEYAAKTINALSLVNKDLNETINDPIFCLKLIKHLSIKFDRANMDVCKILPKRAAHDRF